MKNTIFFCLLLFLFASCQKEVIMPRSIQIVGEWTITEVSAFDSDLTTSRNYQNYVFEFVGGGAYTLTHTNLQKLYGRWTMMDNGAKLVLDPEKPHQAIMRIETLTENELVLVFDETNYSSFKLKRLK